MRRKKKFRFSWGLFTGLIATCIVVTASLYSSAIKPLAALPVPRISPPSLSGPLTLESIGISVLGAQTIDPIDFVNEINKERNKVGALPLRLNKTLMNAAKMRADVILKYQNFSHQDPHEGIELLTVLPKLNYHFAYASENIGMGGLSASNFVGGFMNSRTHRENLLDPKLTDTGAAIVDGPFGQYYVNIAVQLFAIPGGKDEYLGYTDRDRNEYEQQLQTLQAKLHPLFWVINGILLKPGYTPTDKKLLSRQKEILETILVKVKASQPFENGDVALILEYNSLL